MNARPEITDGIPNRRHFEKGRCPRKWTHRLIVCIPDCGHMEKGKAPKKWTQKKGSESPKMDSS